MRKSIFNVLAGIIVLAFIVSYFYSTIRNNNAEKNFNTYIKQIRPLLEKVDKSHNEFQQWIQKTEGQEVDIDTLSKEFQEHYQGFQSLFSQFKAVDATDKELKPLKEKIDQCVEYRLKAIESANKIMDKEQQTQATTLYTEYITKSDNALNEFVDLRKRYFKKYNLVEEK